MALTQTFHSEGKKQIAGMRGATGDYGEFPVIVANDREGVR